MCQLFISESQFIKAFLAFQNATIFQISYLLSWMEIEKNLFPADFKFTSSGSPFHFLFNRKIGYWATNMSVMSTEQRTTYHARDVIDVTGRCTCVRNGRLWMKRVTTTIRIASQRSHYRYTCMCCVWSVRCDGASPILEHVPRAGQKRCQRPIRATLSARAIDIGVCNAGYYT